MDASHYDFAGYVTGFVPPSEDERQALRAELGYGSDEIVCIATVGGSGVGTALLRKIVAAYPALKERIPRLRLIAVAGPRIDPASLGPHRRRRSARLRARVCIGTLARATSRSCKAG